MADVSIGETVRAHNKSGTYIGKVREDRDDRYLIEVLAVEKHPMQGDLHNPNQVEDVFFHERKALAPHEKMNVKKPAVKPVDEEVPPYGESLKQAVSVYKDKLVADGSAYSKKALETLSGLEEIYERTYY